MSRGFAIVVFTLAAFAAQAQETKGAEPAASTVAGVQQEKVEQPLLLASRTAPATLTGPSGTASPAGGANAGAKPAEGTAVEPTDCRIAETYLVLEKLVTRDYEAPIRSQATSSNGWQQTPYVASVTRCGHLFVLQVVSLSRDVWVVRQARLEGPGREVLQTRALRSNAVNTLKGPIAVNVITAKAPPGAKLSRLKLDLSGEDGRVAQVEVGDLP